eukprot:311288_1
MSAESKSEDKKNTEIIDLLHEYHEILVKFDKLQERRSYKKQPPNPTQLWNLLTDKEQLTSSEFLKILEDKDILVPNELYIHLYHHLLYIHSATKKQYDIKLMGMTVDDIYKKKKIIKHKTICLSHVGRMISFHHKNVQQEYRFASKELKSNQIKYLTVILYKIFKCIMIGISFNVDIDFITTKLDDEILSDSNAILDVLIATDSDDEKENATKKFVYHWIQRNQVMEFLAKNPKMSKFVENMNDEWLEKLMKGWASQMYDKRSNIYKTAIELFPYVLIQIFKSSKIELNQLICTVLNLFLKHIIVPSLFRIGRGTGFGIIAHNNVIFAIDILLSMFQLKKADHFIEISKVLNEQQTQTKQREIRASIPIIFAFLMYGTSNGQSLMSNLNDLNDLDSQQVTKMSTAQMPKKTARTFLFDDVTFMKELTNCLTNGIMDDVSNVRDSAFELFLHITIEFPADKFIQKFINEQSAVKRIQTKMKDLQKKKIKIILQK